MAKEKPKDIHILLEQLIEYDLYVRFYTAGSLVTWSFFKLHAAQDFRMLSLYCILIPPMS